MTLNMAKTKTIHIDWDSEDSIKQAEARKEQLENDGYELINTACGLRLSSLTYAKIERALK